MTRFLAVLSGVLLVTSVALFFSTFSSPMLSAALTFGLAGLLSSPNVPPVTVRSWVQVAPADFLATLQHFLAR